MGVRLVCYPGSAAMRKLAVQFSELGQTIIHRDTKKSVAGRKGPAFATRQSVGCPRQCCPMIAVLGADGKVILLHYPISAIKLMHPPPQMTMQKKGKAAPVDVDKEVDFIFKARRGSTHPPPSRAAVDPPSRPTVHCFVGRLF